MKITIDTKEDSHEDIRKVIKMLQHLIGEEQYTNQPDIFEDSSPSTETTNAFVNMFGNTQTANKPKKGLMDEEKEENEEIPRVIPY